MSEENVTYIRNFSLDVNDAVIAACSGLLSILTVFFNILVFVSLRKKASKSLFFKGLMHLTVVDCLTGLAVHSLYSAQMLLGILENKLLYTSFIEFQRFAGYTLQFLGVMTVNFIAVQFYFSIVRPFFYTSNTNRKYSFKVLLFLWLLAASATLSFSVFLKSYWSFYRMILSIGVVCMFLVNLVLYSVTFWKVNQLHKTHPAGHVQRKWGNKLKVCIWILATFFIGYFPLSSLIIYQLTGRTIPFYIYRHLQPWLVLLSITNSFFNPLVYCLRFQDVRRNVLRITTSIVILFVCSKKHRKEMRMKRDAIVEDKSLEMTSMAATTVTRDRKMR